MSEFIDGVRYARRQLGIIVAVFSALAVAALGLPVAQMASIMARDVFHVSAAKYGILAGAYGTGGGIGAPVLGGLTGRFRRGRMLRTGVLMFGAVLFAFAVAPSYWFGVLALGAC